ncbi:hypothetical protein BH24ACT19_BH24ACT19_02470 [soil metagenome]|jgi:hypothetical protein
MDNANFPAESLVPSPSVADFEERVEHRYAENEGVRIHYAAIGEGALIVMLHGFPDFWYTWRYQVAVLYESCRVAALIRTVTTSTANPKV